MLLFNHCPITVPSILGIVLVILLLGTSFAFAHCDTMDGPVVTAAKVALKKDNVITVLKWVKKEYEEEVRTLFQKVQAARKKGSEAQDIADLYFFETVVRLHRVGEGAPYEGLKPAGSVEPIVAKTDAALESGNIENLLTLLTDAMADAIREDFERVIKAKKHAEESVEAGREYVEAYVQFMHYIERIHNDINKKKVHQDKHGH